MKKKTLSYKFLITAGATREFIDPVRFISNPATGRIGYLISSYARKHGHEVILLSAHTHLKASAAVKTVYFETALDLKKLIDKYFSWADCIICTAAVGDFRPARFSRTKIKKQSTEKIKKLKLLKNPDILKRLGKKKQGKVLVGFALETTDILKNAYKKLKDKNLDLIIANQLTTKNVPFGDRAHTSYVISSEEAEKLTKIKKEQLARIILDRVEKLCYSLSDKKGGNPCCDAKKGLH